MSELPDGWETRGKLPTLFRRFDFEGYRQTRDFVDALSALSESQGVHPQSINFGSTYANVTLDPNAAGQADRDLAVRINALYKPAGV